MKLKEIASISGKPGLYRIFKTMKAGVLVETLDEKKSKMSIGTSHRVSILQEVSIYTTTSEGSILLEEVLHRIYQKHQLELPVSNKASNQELVAFLEEFVPEYDKEKVYPSDMKKLVSWYGILAKFSPDTFDTLMVKEEEVAEKQEETIVENTITEVQAENKMEKMEQKEEPDSETKTGQKEMLTKKSSKKTKAVTESDESTKTPEPEKKPKKSSKKKEI